MTSFNEYKLVASRAALGVYTDDNMVRARDGERARGRDEKREGGGVRGLPLNL